MILLFEQRREVESTTDDRLFKYITERKIRVRDIFYCSNSFERLETAEQVQKVKVSPLL